MQQRSTKEELDEPLMRNDGDTNDGHHHHRLQYLPIFKRPEPRQRWVKVTSSEDGEETYVNSLSIGCQEKRTASVSDLVLDLCYVVLLAQIGKSFRAELDNNAWYAFRDFFALFLPIWWQWYRTQRLLNYWETRDFVFTMFFVVNLCLTAMLGMSTDKCGSGFDRTGCNKVRRDTTFFAAPSRSLR